MSLYSKRGGAFFVEIILPVVLAPGTGDNSLVIVVVLGLAAAALLAVFYFMKKRK
jgi:LPXTG-motif cell wall-anchored protein